MLPETKHTVAQLKEAGLTREQFRTRTPWKENIHGYSETIVELLCSYAELAPYVHKLATYFKVVVKCLDGIPYAATIDTTAPAGLYTLEHGQEVQVTTIPLCGSFEQLTLWDSS